MSTPGTMETSSNTIPAIGIDLGTTLSCAAVYENGASEVIENLQGNRLTPSLIFYHWENMEVYYGEAAYNIATRRVSNYLYDIKRIIGRKYDDAYVQNFMQKPDLTYKIVKGEDGNAEVELVHDDLTVQKSPEYICSEILRYLRESACERLGKDVTEAVISVPAKFSGAQRKATRNAAELAGFKVLELITEPVAAAVCYAKEKLDKSDTERILVFDFGGGTLDVSIIETQEQKFKVICVQGDTFLGGRDVDTILVKHFLKEIEKEFGSEIINDNFLERLRRDCEKLKKFLSRNTQYTRNINFLGGKKENNYSLSLKREKFEEICMELFDKAMRLIKQCLVDAGLDKTDISLVLLVGGSTRIPKIREMIQDFFENVPVIPGKKPDEAVAQGAAIQAAFLKGQYKELETYKITEVTPSSLGTSVGRGLMSNIIARNTPLPATKTESFTTTRNDQEACDITIYEGERKNCSFNNILGRFEISNLPKGKAGSIKVDVTYSLDKDGILNVTAKENSTGNVNELKVSVENLYLCEHQIENLVKDAKAHKEDDDKFEKFAHYESMSIQYAQHVLYEIGKLDINEELLYVMTKCAQFVKIARSMPYVDYMQLKQTFSGLRNDIEPIIKKYNIPLEDYIPSNLDTMLNKIVELISSGTAFTLQDFLSLR